MNHCPKRKLTVIIPAYEPPDSFVSYAEAVSGQADLLIVVNDGSGSAFASVFDIIKLLPKTKVIEYPVNRGKGYALKQAFSYCENNCSGDDIIITADCDGQHSIEDVVRLYREAAVNPDSLIIGSRDFTKPNVPKRSRLGNKQMRRLLRFLYGVKIYDTQSGLRGFTVKTARKILKVSGNRFDYETGVLIYAKKNGIPLRELPVETIYPEKPENHVSHFKTFSDSVLVISIIIRNLGFYILSSVLAGIADIVIFTLLSQVILPEKNPLYSLVATVSARIASSVVNFLLNNKLVFKGSTGCSVLRYYLLWTVNLGCSYGNVCLFGHYFGLPVVPVKIIGDLCLALASYQIQRIWVFKEHDKHRFYGSFTRLGQLFARLFSVKYKCEVVPSEEPAVYVCRHLNMHGPYTTLKWMPVDVHPLVLGVFFNRKDCYHQFSDYTFTKRVGKKNRCINLKALFSSLVVPKTIKSLKAVPVYRKSLKSVHMMKDSMKYLTRDENLIVYPDIEYTGNYDIYSDIYTGFLHLGKLYRKETGKTLRFIPLIIDDKSRRIIAGTPITADDKKAVPDASRQLADSINFVKRKDKNA